MTRQNFPDSVKRAAWKRCKGFCEECEAKLFSGQFIYDHVVPDGLGGEPTLDNCCVRCKTCNHRKTYGTDVPQIAKMKRQRDRHAGIKRRKGRALTHPTLKRKVSGEVVPR